MIFIDLIYFLTAFYIVFTTLYLLLLTIAAFFFRKKTDRALESYQMGVVVPDSDKLNVVIVIPAYNESLEITKTIQDIEQLNYPCDQFHIIVIADNCDDSTAQLAREAGAEVVERFNTSSRGKGQALDWFFREHKSLYTSFDAVVIIDADTLPDQEFLNEISASLAHDAVDVVQGFYGVSNPEVNWRTALSFAALCVFHHIRPAGRNSIGGTAGLKGNGMAFKTKIVEFYGWPAFSIVEDIEFSMQLLMDDIIVHYNPDAIVYGEMASGSRQAQSQRKRWEGGRVDLLKQYTVPLLKSFIKERKIIFLDAFMELFTPPLSLLIAGQILMFACSMLLYPHLRYWWGYIYIWPGCLGISLIYVVSGLILKKAPAYVWQSLLCAPLFMLWKIPIYFNLVQKRKGTAWERTERESEKRKGK